MDGQDADDVWLGLSHLRRSTSRTLVSPLSIGPSMKRSQNLGFVVIECHDELAALVKGQPALCAVGLQHSSARSAQWGRSDPGV